MILILSEERDQSTNIIIDWLNYFKRPFIRVNETDICIIKKIGLTTDEVIITIAGDELNFDGISAYWYRRGNFNIALPNDITKENLPFKDEIKKNLKEELAILVDYLHLILRNKKHVGCFFDNYTNKLQNLTLAKKCGLQVPNTIISSKKDLIVDFLNKEKEIITKAISETILFSNQNNGAIQAYTSIVKKDEISQYNESLFPSLFQNKIDKKYELRIFYLAGEFFPMAIFSQSNNKTKTDFRKYDRETPNRCVPYSLPETIKTKLDSFMKLKRLSTGSIDMVVDSRNEYIFLEVNPVGQFGMTSYPCNYYLEKKIAEYLCN